MSGKKLFIIIILAFLLIGCSEKLNNKGVEPQDFIESDSNILHIMEQVNMCLENQNSIFCTKFDTVGNTQPTEEYALDIVSKINQNFTYENNTVWSYNNTIHEELYGDCEDIAMTMVKHMIDDGIDSKYLHLAFIVTFEGTSSHIFVAIDTVDAGMLHLDYAGSGQSIEQINFHMRMDNPGFSEWVKGDVVESVEIKEEIIIEEIVIDTDTIFLECIEKCEVK